MAIQSAVCVAELVLEERLTPDTVEDYVNRKIHEYADATARDLSIRIQSNNLGPRTAARLRRTIEQARA
jgi:hypothetical protein